MTPDVEPDLRLEIAHVLTIDVVAYSTLLINEQSRLMADLVEAVKTAPRFRAADAEGKLIRLPTGDGMALVFLNDAEAPIECAMQIATSLKEHPEVRLRMGIHSGQVNAIRDVNDGMNLAGAGINIQMITTSEIKISVVIEEKYAELAVRALHGAFVEDGAEAPRIET